MSKPEVDFAQTTSARRNRKVKARALADAAIARGLAVAELKLRWSTAADERRREQVRKDAGYKSRPSDQTWALALEMLATLSYDATGGVTCHKCDAPVRRVKTLSGSLIEVDPFAHPAGTVWPRQDHGEVRAVILAGHDTPPDSGTPLFRQHAQSCERGPLAAARRAREAPTCPICSQPMDGGLAFRIPDLYKAHPCCEDEERG